MLNVGQEAKRMAPDINPDTGPVEQICMDRKADDQHLSSWLKSDRRIRLVDVPRNGMNTSASQQQLIKSMVTKQQAKDGNTHSTTVEPLRCVPCIASRVNHAGYAGRQILDGFCRRGN
jgi:hypothetical protein